MKFSHVFHFRKNSKHRNRFGAYDPKLSQAKGGLTIYAKLVPVDPENPNGGNVIAWGVSVCDSREYYNRRFGMENCLKKINDYGAHFTQNVTYDIVKEIAGELSKVIMRSDCWWIEIQGDNNYPLLNKYSLFKAAK